MSRYWKPTFRSMEARIDKDHRTLFKLLDQLATHRRESDLDDLNNLLDQLLEYTFEHFAHEERVMADEGYPRRAEHGDIHAAMRKAFIEALRKVADGSMALPVFLQHLKESFIYHFEGEDMLFVCWRQQAQPGPPTRAKGANEGGRAPSHP